MTVDKLTVYAATAVADQELPGNGYCSLIQRVVGERGREIQNVQRGEEREVLSNNNVPEIDDAPMGLNMRRYRGKEEDEEGVSCGEVLSLIRNIEGERVVGGIGYSNERWRRGRNRLTDARLEYQQ